MLYDIPSLSTGTKLILGLIILIPAILASGFEFFLTKKITWLASGFIFFVCITLSFIGLIQLKSSAIKISDSSLEIKSFLYSRSIPITEVKSLFIYTKGLPEHLTLAVRSNGIGIPGYQAGNFRLKNDTHAFVMMSEPPYIVASLRTNDNHLIFSASQSAFNELSQIINN